MAGRVWKLLSIQHVPGTGGRSWRLAVLHLDARPTASWLGDQNKSSGLQESPRPECARLMFGSVLWLLVTVGMSGGGESLGSRRCSTLLTFTDPVRRRTVGWSAFVLEHVGIRNVWTPVFARLCDFHYFQRVRIFVLLLKVRNKSKRVLMELLCADVISVVCWTGSGRF